MFVRLASRWWASSVTTTTQREISSTAVFGRDVRSMSSSAQKSSNEGASEDATAKTLLDANAKRFDAALSGGRALEALLLGRSEDLRCVDVMCEHVGEACACRLARVIERRGVGLRLLDVSGNRLRALPSAIWGLKELEKLDASDNALTERDVPFDDLIERASETAPKLRELNLRGNVELVDVLGDRWRAVVDAMAKRGVRLTL